MRVLFLSPYIPSRVRVRPYHWIRSLAELGHEVHLIALRPPEDRSASDAEVRPFCSGVEVFSLFRLRTLTNAARALARPSTPLQLAYSHHPEAERRAAILAASGLFDIVHIEHMRGVPLASRICNVPTVFDAVDSISALFAETARHARSRGARLRARLDLERSRRFEARAPFLFSRLVVTSEREAEAFGRLSGASGRARVTVLGNGVDTDYFAPRVRASGRAVVFTGKLSYHANAAAALRLVEQIMPRVWARLPDTRVVLAGKDPPLGIRVLGRDARVKVTGYVEDMRTVFAEAAVAVCPLVYGAGIQNKVLEALSSGIPAVMTVAASRALSGVAGRHYLAFDEDGEMAAAVLALLGDETRRRALADEGRRYVVEHHQWRSLAARLAVVHEEARHGA